MNSESGQQDKPTLRLGDRYQVVQVLSEDLSHRTYLAQDRHNGNALCVVQEFIPPADEDSAIARTQALLDRSVQALAQLDHEQIPKFYPTPADPTLADPTSANTQGSKLYRVRDYVQGPSYQSLLEDRQQWGGSFSETEIIQLLYQLLPVLSHIHSKGIIHGNISPKKIILRQADGLPVLIGFGDLKQQDTAGTGKSTASEVSASEVSVSEVSASEVSASEGPESLKGLLETQAFAESAEAKGIEGFGAKNTEGFGAKNTEGFEANEKIDEKIDEEADEVDPTTDLYGLAATMLVLATGESPEMLHDLQHGSWRGYELLSPKLGQILRKMLSAAPSERFPTADAVLSTLQASETSPDVPWVGVADSGYEDGSIAATFSQLYPSVGIGGAATGVPDMTGIAGETDYDDDTMMLSVTAPEVMPAEPIGYRDSAASESNVYERELRPRESGDKPGASQALIGLLLTLGLAGTALMLYALARNNRSPLDAGLTGDQRNGAQLASNNALRDGEYSPEETARQQAIRSRREALGINESYFNDLVNQLFYQEYPALLTAGPNGGRKELTAAATDEPLRIRRDNIATRVLNRLEGNLDRSSLTALGSYSEESRSQWRSLIASANVNDRALNDLVDAKFFNLFPNQAGQDFLAQPVGQLYYAIAENRAQAISTGSVTETVAFSDGQLSRDVSGRLGPGEGRIYLMSLSAGQLLRLNLSAPPESTQLSLYPPEQTDDSPAVFADSAQTTWSGALTQSGLYEVVVVNRSNQAIDYQLAISVDNVSTTPVAPPAEPPEESTTTEPEETPRTMSDRVENRNRPTNSTNLEATPESETVND